MFHAGETEDRASRRPLVKWRTVAQAERVPDAGEVRRREKQAAASRVASCWTSVRSSRGTRCGRGEEEGEAGSGVEGGVVLDVGTLESWYQMRER